MYKKYNYYHLPVYKDAYVLLIEVFKRTKTLSKEYKYTLGEEIKKNSFAILINIYKANKNQATKILYLEKIKDELEYIRLSFRLLRDLGVFSVEKFALINEKIEIVSKQIVLWQKSEKKKCVIE